MPSFGRRLPLPPPSLKMSTRQKAMTHQLEQLTRISGAQGVMWTPGGPSIVQPGLQFRFGLTGPSGIPAATPIKPKTLTEDEAPGVPGISKDVISVTITFSDTTNGEMKSWPDSKFTGVNCLTSAIPGNTTIPFFLINDLWIAEQSQSGRMAIITGSGITARVGKKVGSGSVSVQEIDSTDMIVDASPPINLTVKNYSITAFSAAKYCFIDQDGHGTWWLVSVEC